jgi:hypothetical protein
LLIKQACLFNQILSLNQEAVVLRQGFFEGPPHALLLVIEYRRHLLPEDSFLPLYSFLLLILGLEIRSLFHPGVTDKFLSVGSLLPLLVEALKNLHDLIHVNVQCFVLILNQRNLLLTWFSTDHFLLISLFLIVLLRHFFLFGLWFGELVVSVTVLIE